MLYYQSEEYKAKVRKRSEALIARHEDRAKAIAERQKVLLPIRKEKKRAYHRKYYKRKREGIPKKIRARNPADPHKRMEAVRRYRRKFPEHQIMQHAVRQMVFKSSRRKGYRSKLYIGCSPGFLRNHLESLFRSDMSWENYGEWHVDHIVPLSWWDLKKHPEHLFEASHWSNLQPLWAKENIRKAARYAG